MKRLFGLSVLSCALASGALMYAVFLGQNAVAGSNGAVRTQTVQAPPGLRFAENERAAGKTNAAGKEAPIPVVDKETLSLYPTAAQCGQCHKEIYEEWSSSQHAYASISPMFHKFEQKFQALTQGTVGTFCVRCHQQVGTQLGEARETPLWARSQISREGVSCITCHRVKETVRQGQRRAPGRARQDLRAGLRQRRKKRNQRRPRQQGNLLRQNQY